MPHHSNTGMNLAQIPNLVDMWRVGANRAALKRHVIAHGLAFNTAVEIPGKGTGRAERIRSVESRSDRRIAEVTVQPLTDTERGRHIGIGPVITAAPEIAGSTSA